VLARAKPWLLGLAALVALAVAVLLVLALTGVYHDMQSVNHLAAQANKGTGD
jgi:hypothetical protein